MDKFSLKKFVIWTLVCSVAGALIISALHLQGGSKYIIIMSVAICANYLARK